MVRKNISQDQGDNQPGKDKIDAIRHVTPGWSGTRRGHMTLPLGQSQPQGAIALGAQPVK